MKPKLRNIKTQRALVRGQEGIILTDPLGISQETLFVPNHLSLLLTLIDGTRDLGTIRAGFELRTGHTVSNSSLEHFISQLDGALFLENDQFFNAHQNALESYRASPTRHPILAGSCYPEDPELLKSFIQEYLDKVSGNSFEETDRVVGLISPHIDYQRGAHVYAQVWSQAKTALEKAELIIILGTDHNDSKGMITLTRQDYESPLGVVPTAKGVVKEIADEIGADAFASELNHRGEHSIEAALVWLQYLLGDNICPVVPVLCGSFQKFIENGESPIKARQIASAVKALNRICSQHRTIIVAAADLAHTGPAFGDPMPLDIIGRAEMAKRDGELIQVLCQGNADNFYSIVQKESDRRHICGLSPIFITLEAITSAKGIPTGYAQCPASVDQTSLVSICGIIYRDAKTSIST
jgi:AmmeMemoRadiSam system protein B